MNVWYLSPSASTRALIVHNVDSMTLDTISRPHQSPDSSIQRPLPNEEIVGVVGGEGEEADVGIGEGGGESGEDAGQGEVEGALYLERTPAGLLSGGGDGDSAFTDEGELFVAAGDAEEAAAIEGIGDRACWREAVDREGLGQNCQGEGWHGGSLVLSGHYSIFGGFKSPISKASYDLCYNLLTLWSQNYTRRRT